MKQYKCFVYKGIVWEVTDGTGNSFYEMVPISDYLDVSKKDSNIAEQSIKEYYNSALSEVKSGTFNKDFYRELRKWELSPLLMRLSNSDSTVFIDQDAINSMNCKRCSFRRFSEQQEDKIEAHIISSEERLYMAGIRDNVDSFLLTKSNLIKWFKKYGNYKESSNSDANVVRRIYRDLDEFYSNGIVFLEQLLHLSDEYFEDVLKKPAWILVRDRLFEDHPDFI